MKWKQSWECRGGKNAYRQNSKLRLCTESTLTRGELGTTHSGSFSWLLPAGSLGNFVSLAALVFQIWSWIHLEDGGEKVQTTLHNFTKSQLKTINYNHQTVESRHVQTVPQRASVAAGFLSNHEAAHQTFPGFQSFQLVSAFRSWLVKLCVLEWLEQKPAYSPFWNSLDTPCVNTH